MITVCILGFSYSFSEFFLLNCLFGFILIFSLGLIIYEYFWGLDEYLIFYFTVICFACLFALCDINHIIVISYAKI